MIKKKSLSEFLLTSRQPTLQTWVSAIQVCLSAVHVLKWVKLRSDLLSPQGVWLWLCTENHKSWPNPVQYNFIIPHDNQRNIKYEKLKIMYDFHLDFYKISDWQTRQRKKKEKANSAVACRLWLQNEQCSTLSKLSWWTTHTHTHTSKPRSSQLSSHTKHTDTQKHILSVSVSTRSRWSSLRSLSMEWCPQDLDRKLNKRVCRSVIFFFQHKRQ